MCINRTRAGGGVNERRDRNKPTRLCRQDMGGGGAIQLAYLQDRGTVHAHVIAGCQKLHVIADNYQLLILSAPVVPARSAGKLWAFYSVSDAKKANIF